MWGEHGWRNEWKFKNIRMKRKWRKIRITRLFDLWKVTVKKSCVLVWAFKPWFHPNRLFFPFLTCSSSPSNFTPITNNIIMSAFSITLFKTEMSLTRKMKIANSLYEWNVIMVVWMKLDCVNKLNNISRHISLPEIFRHFPFETKILRCLILITA